MAALTIHAHVPARRGPNTYCGRRVPDEHVTDDALRVTCNAAACANRRDSVLQALRDATTEDRTYQTRPRWDEPSEHVGTLTYPQGADAVTIDMPDLGVLLHVGDEAAATRYLEHADYLLQACHDALRMIRARQEYPYAAAALEAHLTHQ